MKGLLMIIGVVLIVAWIFGFVVSHVTGFLIHLLLIAGALMIIVNLFGKKNLIKSLLRIAPHYLTAFQMANLATRLPCVDRVI